MIGAGIIGAATAYYLAERGVSVTVLDSSREPRGASAATFGWINANGKRPDHYFELNRDGMAAHYELVRALGDDSWLHHGGSLEWTAAHGDGVLATRVDEHAVRGYPAELIPAARALQLEPELAPALEGASYEVAFYSSEGWADTVALIERLLSVARANGASVRRGATVTHLGPADGQVTVGLQDGDAVIADVVVNCAGPDAGVIAAMAGLSLETAGPLGLNAVTAPTRVRLRRVVRAPGVHFRPETGGRLMVATPAADTALANGADPAELAAQNLQAAARCLVVPAGTAVEAARVAQRAIPADGLPVVGRTADAPWLYHVVTHSGVTLAPLLGRLVADEITDESETDRLAPYRPGRFTAATSPVT